MAWRDNTVNRIKYALKKHRSIPLCREATLFAIQTKNADLLNRNKFLLHVDNKIDRRTTLTWTVIGTIVIERIVFEVFWIVIEVIESRYWRLRQGN